MTEKEKQHQDERRSAPLIRLRIKLRPEAEAKIALSEVEGLPRFGIQDLDEVLHKFRLQKVKTPRPRKLERLTRVKSRWFTLEFPSDVNMNVILSILRGNPHIEAVERVPSVSFCVTVPAWRRTGRAEAWACATAFTTRSAKPSQAPRPVCVCDAVTAMCSAGMPISFSDRRRMAVVASRLTTA